MNLRILKKRKVGMTLFGIQTLATIVFLILLLYLDVLSAGYVSAVIGALVLLDVFVFATQLTKRLKKFGVILSLLMIIILAMGSFYVFKTNSALGSFTGKTEKIDEISVIVLKDDSAKVMADIADYKVGILGSIDRENTDKVLNDIKDKTNKDESTVEYSSVQYLAGALYNKEVGAIILNESFRSTVEDSYKNFSSETRVLDKITNPTVIDKGSDKDLTEEPFSIYLSGIDTNGAISKTSRSDVNIIATINPKTKQILLTSTPRDYYVQTTVSGGSMDKLTHAGMYGIDCSIGTLEKLYDVDVQYYFRVNFTGFKKIVDALGGVTVHSDYTFNSDWGPSFVKGDNHVNGKQALAFSRQRHDKFRGRKTGLVGGDRQRGKDQQYLIKAIINKATSPAIITKYSNLMDSLSNSFETSLTSGEITFLIKMQIDDMSSWDVVNISVTGGDGRESTYSIPNSKEYVMYQDQSNVNAARKMIDKVIAGEKVTDQMYEDLKQSGSTNSSTNQ